MSNPALIDELEKQFRDNPRRMFARLANEYRKGGDFMRAIEICNAHVPLQPGYISGHIVLGQALYDAGELEQAQDTFQTALSLDPENLIALRQLGDIARSRRDFASARSWYTKLLEVDPQNDEVVAQLGELSLVGGHDSNANGHREGSWTATPTGQQGVLTAGAGYEVTSDDSADAPVVDLHEGSAADEDSIQATVTDAVPALDFSDDESSDDSFGYQAMPTLDDPHEFSVGESFGDHESLSATPDGAANLSSDDDDVSWIEAAGEANQEEFSISGLESAGDSLSSDTPGADLDLIFESEEHEAPLRPHSGEGLAIIAEEDPLAGVQPVNGAERSPFGDPIETTAGNVADEMTSFEPLPIMDMDSSGVTEVAPVGGIPLWEELSQWTEDASAETSGESAQVGSADDQPDSGGEAFEVSEAETLLEDSEADFSWEEPRLESSETPVDGQAEPDTTEPGTDEFTAAIASSSTLPEESADSGWEPAVDALEDSSGESSDDAPIAPEVAARVPDSRDEAGVSDDESPPTFVTETMAELYLQQGFRSQALEVYRSLAAQSPDDSRLRDRVAQLEQGSHSSGAGNFNGATPDSTSRPEHTSAAAFFKRLASVQVPSAAPIVEPQAEVSSDWAEVALSGAGEISEQDDKAAKALASGYEPAAEPAPRRPSAATRAASSALSLDDIFGTNEQQPRGTPPIGSLDAFFTPEGERASGEVASGASDDIDDLQAFNAWLEGLKK